MLPILFIKIFILSLSILFTVHICVAIPREQCQDVGFNANVLLCTTCDSVEKILKNDSILEKCKSCCINDPTESDPTEKYRFAVLEVDTRFLGFYPELDAVIKMKDSLKLTVRYRFGSPTLYMYTNKKDSEPAEQLSVSSWNKETITDYLKSHVVK